MRYRKILYQNYHSTQSGRDTGLQKDEYFKKQKFHFSREINEILNHLKKESKIFDMGCGCGSLLAVLKDHGFSDVEGLDISSEQIKLAKQYGVNEAREGDALEFISTKENYADVLFGMDIIEHLTKDELVDWLLKAKNFLRPNGTLILRTPNADAFFTSLFVFGDFTHENILNSSSARQVLLSSGFQNVEIKEGSMLISNPILEGLRRVLWFLVRIQYRVHLFASGRSGRNVLFSPNMLIIAKL